MWKMPVVVLRRRDPRTVKYHRVIRLGRSGWEPGRHRDGYDCGHRQAVKWILGVVLVVQVERVPLAAQPLDLRVAHTV